MYNKLKRLSNLAFMSFNDEIQNITSSSATTYGTIEEDQEKRRLTPEEEVETQRITIYETKNVIESKRNNIRRLAYFLIFIGFWGVLSQVISVIASVKEVVVIQGISEREEIEISQGYLFGERFMDA
mmetsp:Transcript_31507/g.27895  ORF Transcript_31507/g.27895 Transcript_31507/m.27895 type:complete len:127 (-) Transcript_31507:569-949(-)